MNRRTRIGSGAGFAGDRIEPAVDLVERGEIDDLVLECLAERTIALGQLRRSHDAGQGHDPMIERRMRALLPVALARGTRVISNMGAANPRAAGRVVSALATESGLDCRIAVVDGDDVLDSLDLDAPALEDGRPLRAHGEIVSANAYLGADAIAPALHSGADVVITGRVADPSLFVAPLVDRLGWDLDDLNHLASTTLAGHLLECGAQITGGYFSDPGYKDVPDLAHLGFPYADVESDGAVTIGKISGTGGCVSRATVCEQLLYEISDPGAYLTPDVTLDIRDVRVEEEGYDRVRVIGAAGRPRPDQLKVSVGYRAGHRAEAEVSYFGPGAVARARLAGEVVTTRLREIGHEARVDLIGSLPERGADPDVAECRLRVAGIASDADEAATVCHEVEALYTNGPAGGGGVRTSVTEVVGIVSTLVPRASVSPSVTIQEAGDARRTA